MMMSELVPVCGPQADRPSEGVIQELEYLGTTLQDAFGVIGQTMEQFESLFVDTEGVVDGR